MEKNVVTENKDLYSYLDKEIKNNKEIDTNLTYPEIRRIVFKNNIINNFDKELQTYKYFIMYIYSNMIKTAQEKGNNIFNMEYAVMNQMGVIIFALPETPFTKLFLNELLTEEEYQNLTIYIQHFINDYNLGSIIPNKFGFSINFNTNIAYASEVYFMEMQRLALIENNNYANIKR